MSATGRSLIDFGFYAILAIFQPYDGKWAVVKKQIPHRKVVERWLYGALTGTAQRLNWYRSATFRL
jgi:hypothetical protein